MPRTLPPAGGLYLPPHRPAGLGSGDAQALRHRRRAPRLPAGKDALVEARLAQRDRSLAADRLHPAEHRRPPRRDGAGGRARRPLPRPPARCRRRPTSSGWNIVFLGLIGLAAAGLIAAASFRRPNEPMRPPGAPRSSTTSTRRPSLSSQSRLRYTLAAGGLAVFFSLVLLVTGILEMFFYVPTPEAGRPLDPDDHLSGPVRRAGARGALLGSPGAGRDRGRPPAAGGLHRRLHEAAPPELPDRRWRCCCSCCCSISPATCCAGTRASAGR